MVIWLLAHLHNFQKSDLPQLVRDLQGGIRLGRVTTPPGSGYCPTEMIKDDNGHKHQFYHRESCLVAAGSDLLPLRATALPLRPGGFEHIFVGDGFNIPRKFGHV
jgi:hypothetical protein